jgi:NhaC family Na+:H+ antiporter
LFFNDDRRAHRRVGERRDHTYVVYYATKFISPHVFLPAAFFGCAAGYPRCSARPSALRHTGRHLHGHGKTMGVSSFWLGGAILAGAFFGDRSSPMSTSALSFHH